MYDEYVLTTESDQHVHNKGDWAAGLSIEVGHEYRNSSLGGSYVCLVAHTSAAGNEPGVGGSWATYWRPTAQGTQGTPGGAMAWHGAYDAGHTYAAGDGVRSAEGNGYYSLHGTNTGNTPPADGSDDSHWSCFAKAGTSPANHATNHQSGGSDPIKLDDLATPDNNTDLNASSTRHGLLPMLPNDAAKVLLGDGTWGTYSGGAQFWTTVPGTPTRISNTQFSITDTGNANLYDLLFQKRTVLHWLESGNRKRAMVISATYATDAVTITIRGDALAAGFTAMKYCLVLAEMAEFIIPGYVTAGTDVARTHIARCAMIPLSTDVHVKVAGTTSSTLFDINDDGTSIMNGPTGDISLASGNTQTIDTVVYNTAVIAKDSYITLDVDGVSTTPPTEAIVCLYWYPASLEYRA